MRAQAKPFATEYKSRKPPKAAALFDESEIISGEVRPPRDVNEDLSTRHDGGYDEALRAADAVFGGNKKEAAASSASEIPQEPEKRILTDLSYIDPLAERLAAAPARRGRKPGSKNAPRAPLAITPVLEIEASMPTAMPAAQASSVQQIGLKRRRGGFLAKLRARRSTKPGERWKLKARRKSGQP